MTHLSKTMVLLVLVLLLLVVGEGEGKEIYVKNLTDSSSGSGTKNDPFGSFGAAMLVAVSGDRILAFPGTYEGEMNTNLNLKTTQTLLSFDAAEEGSSIFIDLSVTESIPFFSQLDNFGENASNITVTFNNFIFSGQTGGDVFQSNMEGIINFNNCEFINNPITKGSVLNIENTAVNMMNITFKYNMASPNTLAAFVAKKSTVHVNDTYFGYCGVFPDIKNNISGSNGGAIYAENSHLGFINSHFYSNVAEKGAAIMAIGTTFGNTSIDFRYNFANSDGGALYIDSQYEDIYIDNRVNFVQNQAQFGGAAYITGNVGGKVTISGGTFNYNNAGISGGALYFYNTLTVSVQNCEFTMNSLNKTDGFGPAIAVVEQRIYETVIDNCHFKKQIVGYNGWVLYTNYSNNIKFKKNNIIDDKLKYPFYFNHSDVVLSVFARQLFLDSSSLTYCDDSNTMVDYWNIQSSSRASSVSLLQDLNINKMDVAGESGDFQKVHGVDFSTTYGDCDGKKKQEEKVQLNISGESELKNFVFFWNMTVILSGELTINSDPSPAGQGFATTFMNSTLNVPMGSLVVNRNSTLVYNSHLYSDNFVKTPIQIGGSLKMYTGEGSQIQGNVDFLNYSKLKIEGTPTTNDDLMATIQGNVTIHENAYIKSEVVTEEKSVYIMHWNNYTGKFIVDNSEFLYDLAYSPRFLKQVIPKEDSAEVIIIIITIIGVVIFLGVVVFLVILYNKYKKGEHGYDDLEDN